MLTDYKTSGIISAKRRVKNFPRTSTRRFAPVGLSHSVLIPTFFRRSDLRTRGAKKNGDSYEKRISGAGVYSPG